MSRFVKALLMIIGGIIGAVGASLLATYLFFTFMGDGQAGFGGCCVGVPSGGALGVLLGWWIAKTIKKDSGPGQYST